MIRGYCTDGRSELTLLDYYISHIGLLFVHQNDDDHNNSKRIFKVYDAHMTEEPN